MGVMSCCVVFAWLQDPEPLRWYARSVWMHAIVTFASTPVAQRSTSSEQNPIVSDVPADVVALLRDHRLTRAGGSSGKLMCSVVGGMVAPFLPKCCARPSCPQAQPMFFDQGGLRRRMLRLDLLNSHHHGGQAVADAASSSDDDDDDDAGFIFQDVGFDGEDFDTADSDDGWDTSESEHFF